MAVSPSRAPVDPAVDAARLLERLGFVALALCPLAALVSRRGVVVLAPCGLAMIFLAGVIGSEGREPFAWLRRHAFGLATAAGAFLLFWTGLSIVWTPFPLEAVARWINLAALVLGAAATVATMRAHVRASHLNLFPIGLAAAALAAVALVARYGFDPALETDRRILDRVPLLFGLLLPPCTAWLMSRGRLVAGALLAALVAAALTAAGGFAVVGALAAGGAVYALSALRPAAGVICATALTAGLVLFAPAVPFLLAPLAEGVLGAGHSWSEAIRVWAQTVAGDPVRLITGHGFDTAMRARDAGLVPAGAPRGLLFEVWFEVGILGAVALAVLLHRALRAAAAGAPAVAPGAMMTIVVAVLLAVFGKAGLQSWWLTMLALTAVTLVAVERGQYRTVRPKTRPAPLGSPTTGPGPGDTRRA